MSRHPRYPCMTIIATSGTHFDVGYNIGCTLETNIKQFYQQAAGVADILEPFYSCHEGRNIYQQYLKTVQDQFPQYINEMKGMSEGSGIAFEKVFLYNISKEIQFYHWPKMKADEKIKEDAGCSDVMINRPGVKYILHNEDLDPVIKPYGYLVKADIQDDQLDSFQNFTAYSNPGFLPGTTFGYNKHGMTFTLNALYPNKANVYGTPRNILTRHMLSSVNIVDALDILRNKGYGCAFAFNVNLASIKDPRDMWAIEVCFGEGESRLHCHTVPEQKDEDSPCHYIHVNNFKHFSVEEVADLRTSTERGKRSAEMKPPRTLEEGFRILGDTHSQQYPIYRTPSTCDPVSTVATAAFHILERRLDLYMENPKLVKDCFLSLPITM